MLFINDIQRKISWSIFQISISLIRCNNSDVNWTNETSSGHKSRTINGQRSMKKKKKRCALKWFCFVSASKCQSGQQTMMQINQLADIFITYECVRSNKLHAYYNIFMPIVWMYVGYMGRSSSRYIKQFYHVSQCDCMFGAH